MKHSILLLDGFYLTILVQKSGVRDKELEFFFFEIFFLNFNRKFNHLNNNKKRRKKRKNFLKKF